MTEKPFATQVIEEMNSRGWSMAELERQSGVSYNIINKLKQRPDSSTNAVAGRKLAAALGLQWQEQNEESLPLAAPPIAPQSTLIDVYDVQASAGYGAIVDGEKIAERLSFPPDYLKHLTKSHPRHLSIIGVKGDSMLPTLADDDVVMLDTSKTSLDYDGLFVLRFGDALHVKRISRGSNGCVRIISDNATIYPPIEIARSEVEVIGRIIWMGKKV